MQTAEVRDGNCAADPEPPSTLFGRVAIQRLLRALGVAVARVFAEHSSGVCLAENDHVVEALASDRSDHTLSVRVLERRVVLRHDLPEPELAHRALELVAVDRIAVAQ